MTDTKRYVIGPTIAVVVLAWRVAMLAAPPAEAQYSGRTPTPTPLPDVVVYVNDKPNGPVVGSRQTFEVIVRNSGAVARDVGGNISGSWDVPLDAARPPVPLTDGARCDVLPDVGSARWMVVCGFADIPPGYSARFMVHTLPSRAGTYSVSGAAGAMFGGVLSDANPADNQVVKTFVVAP